MGRSHHGEEWGFEVPGGFVTTKLRGGVPLLDSVIRSSWASARGAEQDIVIQDESRERELYREGPFNNISVEFPLKRILAEIESKGLDEFLRRRQIENSQIGPVSAPSGNMGYWRWAVTYYRLAVEKLIRRGPSPSTPRS
jgi:hypothetical protein